MNSSNGFNLDFERPIVELEKKIEDLGTQAETDGLDLDQEIQRLQARAEKLREEIYSNLNAWQRVQISRHPDRPYALDYVERILSDFSELHGDRLFGGVGIGQDVVVHQAAAGVFDLHVADQGGHYRLLDAPLPGLLDLLAQQAVSYTHLTLPTILLV